MWIFALLALFQEVPDWQAAAGGKMAFEVASVKPSTGFRPPSFPLDNRNAYSPGGRLSATMPLAVFISFAYKLSTAENQIEAQLPKSLRADLFDIEARAEGNPTKDQMRLMMRSLLAERFKLAAHFETAEGPVFDLILVKPGKRGPKLRPHAEGPPCPGAYTSPVMSPNAGEVFPEGCGTASMRGKNGVLLMGSRDSSPASLADAIYGYGFIADEVDRPVVDKTGIDGTFDFTVQYARGENNLLRGPGPPGPDAAAGEGSPFLNAVREQLGLKLVASKGAVRRLVIDHVERPGEN